MPEIGSKEINSLLVDGVYQDKMREKQESYFIKFDKAFDIVSTFDNRKLTRDADEAKNLDQYGTIIQSDEIQRNLLLQRTLSTTRAIHFTIAQKISELRKNELENKTLVGEYEELLKKLKGGFDILELNINNLNQDNIEVTLDGEKIKTFESIEKFYNKHLAEILFDANLDEGARTTAEIEELLFQYRLAASVLDSAPTLETTIKVDDNLRLEQTLIPITQKTDAQKKQLKPLDTVDLYPDPKDLTYQTAKLGQHARHAVKELIKSDDRMLGAQWRKSVPATLKNAYIQINKLKDRDGNVIGQSFSFIRNGSPVYVGKGVTNKNESNEYVLENLKQLKQAVEKHHIKLDKAEWVSLVTGFWVRPNKSAKDEKKIIDGLAQALSGGDEIALYHAGLNWFALWQKAKEIPKEKKSQNPWTFTIATKKNRLKTILDHIKNAGLVILQCASGKDRTGVMSFLYQNEKEKEILEEANITVDEKTLLEAHAKTLTEPVISGLLSPGSPFLQDDQGMSETFDTKIQPALFQHQIARTNKEVKILEAPKNINKPSNITRSEYEAAKLKIEAKLKIMKTTIANDPLLLLADKILDAVKEIENTTDRKKLNLLTELLSRTHDALSATTLNEKDDATLKLYNLFQAVEKQLKSNLSRKFHHFLGHLFSTNLVNRSATFAGNSLFMSNVGYRTLKLLAQLNKAIKEEKKQEVKTPETPSYVGPKP